MNDDGNCCNCDEPMYGHELDVYGLCHDCAEEIEHAASVSSQEDFREAVEEGRQFAREFLRDEPSQEDLAYVAQSLGLDPDRLNPNK